MQTVRTRAPLGLPKGKEVQLVAFVLSVSLTKGLAHCRCLLHVCERNEAVEHIYEQG